MSQHEYFEGSDSEDLDHIINLKRIITAISDYLKSEDVPADKINSLANDLKLLAKNLYMDFAVLDKDEDEDEKSAEDESEIWFDEIYENEDYPY